MIVRKKKRRSRHYLRKIFWSVMGLAVAIIIFGCGFVFYNLHNAAQDSYKPVIRSHVRSPESQINSKKPISVLLLGTDTGSEGRHYKGRTDTIMVNTVNPKDNTTTLTSIPRDSHVYYDDDPVKINSVYTYGGVGKMSSFVQNWLGVPIDYYVLSNMNGLIKTVNKENGITINPLRSFKNNGVTFKKGHPMHMNGKQTLAYLQMRYQDPKGDYGRQMRNRQVLFALLNKAAKLNNLVRPSVVNSLSHSIKTDLSFSDLEKLALHYRGANQHEKATHLQGYGKKISGYDYQMIPASQKRKAKQFIKNNLGE